MLLCACFFATVFVFGKSDTDALKGPIIGIDLGTTYSCVGIFKNGKVDIILNDQGNRITPSYVAFTEDGERLVGDSAKSQLTVNPENTVFDAKRLIGRKFDDPSVQSDMKMWPFKIKNKNGRPHIEVTVGKEKKLFTPEEISAMVLANMKHQAEEYLGTNVTNAVITVPAYFNDAQRLSTKDAGTIAGLNVVRIINEPTAAAIAYGINAKSDTEKNVVVFDLGGGTFDVSVLTCDGGVFEVASTSGDTHLGGEDFDSRLMEYLIKEITAQGHKVNTKDLRLIQRIRRDAEKAKRALSKTHEVTVEIELSSGDVSVTVTRSTFNRVNEDLFQKTLTPLRKAVEDSKIKKDQFHEVLLVGGSTRIPKIQEMVKEFFNGKELNRGINPDEAVAFGAAVQGGILSGEQEVSELVLVDINPLTLGIEVRGEVMEVLVSRGSKIPTEQTKTFTTVNDYQTTVRIAVYEGERSMVKDNNKLGQFDLEGLTSAPRGQVQIDVKFTVDHNGIIHVEATEKASGRSNKIKINNEQRQLNQEDIARMVDDAQKYREADQKAAEKVKARLGFESNLYSLKNELKDEAKLGSKLTEDEKSTVGSAVEESIKWLEQNQSASIEEVKEQQQKFQTVVSPILSKYTGGGQMPSGSSPGDQTQEEL